MGVKQISPKRKISLIFGVVSEWFQTNFKYVCPSPPLSGMILQIDGSGGTDSFPNANHLLWTLHVRFPGPKWINWIR